MKYPINKAQFLWIVLGLLLTGNILFFYSIPDREEEMLKEALLQAHSNRKELERVLKHYEKEPEKLEAAKFLIRNMPGLYSYTGEMLDSFRIALDQYANSYNYDQKRFAYLENFPYEKVQIKSDIETVTAEYLIENIEYSFKAWKETTWGKHISMEQFRELILPYRIGNEPLTHWKKKLYERLHPVMDSIYQGSDAIAACDSMSKYLNQQWWVYCDELNGPDMSAEYLFQKRIGDCEAVSAFTTFAMRAVGIPVAMDTYIYSPEFANMHCWNIVLDSTGISIPFMIGEFTPKRGESFNRKMGKAYRHTFAIQSGQLKKLLENKLPHSLKNCRLKDVTEIYRGYNKVIVPCDFIPEEGKLNIFLGVFTPNGWIAIGEAEKYHKRKATFKNIEPGPVYIPLYQHNDIQIEAGYPFRLDAQTDKVVVYNPQTQTETIKLLRKYPAAVSVETYMQRMTNGRFEGANRSDFSDATILYELGTKEWPQQVYNEYHVSADEKFRYVRYISNKKFPGDIAEVAWYNSLDKDQKLTGVLISTPPYKNQPECDPKNAIDDDPLTFFSSEQSPGWIGLDLETPQRIEKIVFMPRNDDNFIRKGDEYELFYFSKYGWCSLGKKKAVRTELFYQNAPRNAVFWLRDLTRGKEEQIFTYENGKQYFNHYRKILPKTKSTNVQQK